MSRITNEGAAWHAVAHAAATLVIHVAFPEYSSHMIYMLFGDSASSFCPTLVSGFDDDFGVFPHFLFGGFHRAIRP